MTGSGASACSRSAAPSPSWRRSRGTAKASAWPISASASACTTAPPFTSPRPWCRSATSASKRQALPRRPAAVRAGRQRARRDRDGEPGHADPGGAVARRPARAAISPSAWATPIVVIARTSGPGAFQLTDRVGVVRPAHCTALGKIILAAPASRAARALSRRAELKAFTAKSITDVPALLREIEEVRRSRHCLRRRRVRPRGALRRRSGQGLHAARSSAPSAFPARSGGSPSRPCRAERSHSSRCRPPLQGIRRRGDSRLSEPRRHLRASPSLALTRKPRLRIIRQ